MFVVTSRQFRPAALSGIILVILAVASCSEPSKPNPRYTHALAGVPENLDPTRLASSYETFVAQNLYETLYVYRYLARPYDLKPSLALDFPTIDDSGLIYQFEISPGHRFASDPGFPDGEGREVTAEDVVYSLSRHFDPDTQSRHRWLWDTAIRGASDSSGDAEVPRGLRVLGRYRFEIHLQRPMPELLHTLATPYAAIVPREIVELRGPEFGRRPVGSGPYRLVAFDRDRMRLEANANYPKRSVDLAQEGFLAELHGGLGLEAIDGAPFPVTREVAIEFIPDGASRWLAYQSGLVQFIRAPDFAADRVLASRQPPALTDSWAAGHRLVPAEELGLVFLSFNFANPPFGGDHPQARDRRCTVVQAIDWPLRNQLLFASLGRRIHSLFPSAVMADLDLQPAHPHHTVEPPEWPDLVYGSLSGIRGRQEFDLLKNELTRAGIPSDRIRMREFLSIGGLIKAIAAGEVHLYLMGWQMDFPDPLNNLQLFFGGNANPGPNFGQFQHPGFDQAFEAAGTTPPGPERDHLVQAMSQILVDECAYSGGMTRTSLFLFSEQVAVWPDNGPLNGGVLPFIFRSPPD